MNELIKHLRENRPKPFRASAVYVQTGDYLIYLLKDVQHVSERLDDVITLYLERDSRELVGCKVKGVRHILDRAGAFSVGVSDGEDVKLGLFFFAGSSIPTKADQFPKTKWYERLREWSDVTVNRREFTKC